jgi:drug/metabolite transporter (DMT)-like permease
MRYSVAMKINDFVLLLGLAALWGVSYLFFCIAAPVLGAIPFSAIWVVIAASALLIYVAVARNMPDFRARWKQFLVMGLLNNVIPLILIATAVTRFNASLAAILNATPLLVG